MLDPLVKLDQRDHVDHLDLRVYQERLASRVR